MTKKILIVDDEEAHAESLQVFLKSKSFECDYCTSANQAIELLQNNTYNLIISDIHMPEISGIEFFEKVHADLKSDNTGFILMTGNADLISLQSAYDLGVDEFILKPLDLEDLIVVIDLVLQNANPEFIKTKFYSVPITEFQQFPSNFDIYVQINHNFLCLAKKGQELSVARLQKISTKGIKDIYLSHVDYSKYTDLPCALQPPETIKSAEKLKKVKLNQHLKKTALQSDFTLFLEPELFRRSASSFENYIQVAFENDEIFKMLDALSTANIHVLNRSAQIALLSTAIAIYWKWTHPKILSKITLAALLCDIGFKNNPELYFKKRHEFTDIDLKVYEAHPKTSSTMLKTIKDIPEEILKVALQHHENEMSLGFPERLAKEKQLPYARLIHGVVELFEYLDENPTREDIKMAVEKLYSFHRKTISEQVLKSLFTIFGLTVPKDLTAVLLPFDTARMS